MASPVARGSSWARSEIGAAATGLHHSHSNIRPEPLLRPTPQLSATPDPLTHWARPGMKPTSLWILVGFLTHWVTMGTPWLLFFFPFRAAHVACRSSQARDRIGATAASLYTTPQQCQIQSATYTTGHGNTRSPTHWGRPGIEPAS